jgi:hypothetical protein
MVNQLDSHELKILSDVLALVVDEHPGASASALEFLQRRARNSKVTGGALKDLLVKTHAMLASDLKGGTQETRLRAADETNGRLDATVNDLQQQLRQAWLRIDNLAAENLRYQRLLAEAKEEMLEFRQAKDHVRLRRRLAGGFLVILLATGGAVGWWLGSAGSIAIPAHQGNALPLVASRQAADVVLPAKLTPEDTAAIVGHFKECLAQPIGRVPFEIPVMVTTDEDGVVRKADVVADSSHRLTDTAFQQMAERLSNTLLSPACAKLPLDHTEQHRKLAFRLLIKP